MMNDAGKFLDGLMNLDKEKITMPMTEAMLPYTTTPGFDPELVKSKSFAASGTELLGWRNFLVFGWLV